jgi:hypothetical protein
VKKGIEKGEREVDRAKREKDRRESKTGKVKIQQSVKLEKKTF